MEKLETEEPSADSFRFCSKEEYEEEMKKIISLRKLPPKKLAVLGRDPSTLDEEYETLAEEYLRFRAASLDA